MSDHSQRRIALRDLQPGDLLRGIHENGLVVLRVYPDGSVMTATLGPGPDTGLISTDDVEWLERHVTGIAHRGTYQPLEADDSDPCSICGKRLVLPGGGLACACGALAAQPSGGSDE